LAAGKEICDLKICDLRGACRNMPGSDAAPPPEGGRRYFLLVSPAKEAVIKSRGNLDQHRASFDTAAEFILGPRTARTRGRPAQDDEFCQCHQNFTSC
jgi:hypothetical protein